MISAACRRKEIVMKRLAFAVGVFVLSAGTVLAASESSLNGPPMQQPAPAFKALAQVMAPIGLTDEQLAKIEGSLANFHALPPDNPGTSNAVTKIPPAVFTGHVRDQWFGKASIK
jgi:hypothetical protein